MNRRSKRMVTLLYILFIAFTVIVVATFNDFDERLFNAYRRINILTEEVTELKSKDISVNTSKIETEEEPPVHVVGGHDIEPCEISKYTEDSLVIRVSLYGINKASYILEDYFKVDSKWFNETCFDYGVDPIFALATMIMECGWRGTSYAYTVMNNPAGITNPNTGEYYSYDTKESGIESMIRLISNYGLNKDRWTVKEIRDLWSAADDTKQVVDIMNTIVETENEI